MKTDSHRTTDHRSFCLWLFDPWLYGTALSTHVAAGSQSDFNLRLDLLIKHLVQVKQRTIQGAPVVCVRQTWVLAAFVVIYLSSLHVRWYHLSWIVLIKSEFPLVKKRQLEKGIYIKQCLLPNTRGQSASSHTPSGTSITCLGHVFVIPDILGQSKVNCRPSDWHLSLITIEFILFSLTAALPLYPVLRGCPLSQWFHPRSSCCMGQVPVQCFFCSDWEVQINGLHRGWGMHIHGTSQLPSFGVFTPSYAVLSNPLCRGLVICKPQ